MQTQRTILWVIFTMSLLFLWDAWQAHNGKPSMFHGSPKPAQTTPAAPGAAPAKADGSVPAAGAPAGVPVAPTATVPGAAAPSAAAGQPPIRLRTDVLAIDVDPVGGEVQRAELLKFNDPDAGSANLVLFDERNGHTYVAQTGLASPSLPNHRTPFVVEDGPRELAAGQDALVLKMSAEQGGAKLVRTYTLKRGSYAIDVKTEVTNLGELAIRPVLYMQISRDKVAPQNVAGIASHFVPIGSFGPVFYTDEIKFRKVDFSALDKKPTEEIAKDVKDGWAGVMQHYFVSAWVPQKDAPRTLEASKIDAELYVARIRQTLPEIAPKATVATNAVLYVGPQDQRVLAEIAPGLDLVVDYGWLTVIAKPIFELLQFLYGIVKNWGWAIVLLTLIIKFAFFPLQAASYRSMAKMKKVGPKLQQLKERYGDDRVKMNQAMMELYKTEKINPLGGCLPIVVQIPVFIALYYVLFASVELRGAPWLGWIKDLASPDPFYILPLLMAISMFFQTKLNPTPPDPLQAKMMMWMPLIFSVMFFFFPAGLVLYWLVNNLFSIAQQWVITRRIEGKPVFGRAPA
ncbi:MAG: rane protein insertase YidC [Pseudomonadota bacterium]|jgi:YidC/Oxa1 family membrane protein insertase